MNRAKITFTTKAGLFRSNCRKQPRKQCWPRLEETPRPMACSIQQLTKTGTRSIADLYGHVRARTLEIVAPLEIEDYVIQTAEFMSPPRWHIGHTSWFFETVLQKYQAGYKTYSEDFLFFFNSYYEGLGQRIERPERGTRSRPTVA